MIDLHALTVLRLILIPAAWESSKTKDKRIQLLTDRVPRRCTGTVSRRRRFYLISACPMIGTRKFSDNALVTPWVKVEGGR